MNNKLTEQSIMVYGFFNNSDDKLCDLIRFFTCSTSVIISFNSFCAAGRVFLKFSCPLIRDYCRNRHIKVLEKQKQN